LLLLPFMDTTVQASLALRLADLESSARCAG